MKWLLLIIKAVSWLFVLFFRPGRKARKERLDKAQEKFDKAEETKDEADITIAFDRARNA